MVEAVGRRTVLSGVAAAGALAALGGGPADAAGANPLTTMSAGDLAEAIRSRRVSARAVTT